MHEAAIASGIAALVRKSVAPGRAPAVRTIRVKIGRLRAVQAEALEFAFEALVRDSDLAASSLEIESIAARAKCEDCGTTRELEEFPAECPACGGVRLNIQGGMELFVESLMLDE